MANQSNNQKKIEKPKKICPFRMVSASDLNEACVEHHCALWTRPYTTEGQDAGGMCALRAIAEKNSDGKIVV